MRFISGISGLFHSAGFSWKMQMDISKFSSLSICRYEKCTYSFLWGIFYQLRVSENVMTSKIETTNGNFCKATKTLQRPVRVVYGAGNKVWQNGQKARRETQSLLRASY